MKTLKIRKERLSRFIDSLTRSHQLFGPVKQADIVDFSEIREVTEIDLNSQNSRLSAKSLFLPQSELMFEYSVEPDADDAHILKEVPKDYTPRAVIGIRPCDARAFKLVDVNFDTPECKDPWWVKAREATTLVGLGCNAPCSTCFCTSVGGGPCDEQGLDVLLIDTGEAFLAKILTEKGNDLVEAAEGVEPADEGLVQKAMAIGGEAERKITSRIDMSRFSQLDALALHDADFWKELHFACINCGICTYLCPTCWCFDIQDETCGGTGRRIRNWDSCMFPLFTLHASGHNPRGEKIQRVRQRFMHKLKYYVDKYRNGVACVGCGRCVQHCPVNIDIREVIKRMNSFGR